MLHVFIRGVIRNEAVICRFRQKTMPRAHWCDSWEDRVFWQEICSSVLFKIETPLREWFIDPNQAKYHNHVRLCRLIA
jgi:hypothetical protein